MIFSISLFKTWIGGAVLTSTYVLGQNNKKMVYHCPLLKFLKQDLGMSIVILH